MFLSLCLIWFCSYYAQEARFVGPNNNFMCNCANDKCEQSGLCEKFTYCKEGYFGFACQYSNAFDYKRSPIPELADNQYTTCVTDESIEITFSYTKVRFVSLVVKTTSEYETLRMSFKENNVNKTCKGSLIKAELYAIEYHCLSPVNADGLIIYNVKKIEICHISVSKGRNLGINPKVLAFTTVNNRYREEGLSDGVTDFQHQTCYLARSGMGVTITLNSPIRLGIIELFDIPPEFSSLGNVIITITTENRSSVIYEIKANNGRQVKSIILDHDVEAVLNLTFASDRKFGACEIELLGDCSRGTFGLTCADRCAGSCTWCNLEGRCLDDGTIENCSDSCGGDKSCSSNGTCKNGCKPGYYDLDCKKSCSQNCAGNQSCLLNGTCRFGCQPGFFGYNCSSICSDSCEGNKSCSLNGTCIHGCKSGFYGLDCKKNCSDSCGGDKSCSSNGTCKNGCKPGYYGLDCKKNCSDFCGGDKSCLLNGTCTYGCMAGFYGSMCNLICSTNCAHEKSCNINGTCSYGCLSGFFGHTCMSNCSDSCKGDKSCSLNGTCKYGCKPGFYGLDCKLNCSQTCEADKSCDLEGTCTNGCLPGFFKHNCSSKCSDLCDGDKSCSLNGTCKYGCMDGFYGPYCNSTCNRYCGHTGACNLKGECNFGCEKGYYGTSCDLPCSAYCTGNRHCYSNGTCISGCTAGFWGEDCQIRCNPNCARVGSCNSIGSCKHGCRPGYYESDCSKKCYPGCAGDGSCNSYQVCTHGCRPGYYDTLCSKLCSTCNESCDIEGNCIYGCKPSFFGRNCTSYCSPYCANDGSCNDKGICTYGCEPGYFGPRCFHLGLSSNYGENHTWNCHCHGEKCTDRFDYCSEMDKCITGWFGYHCDFRDIGVRSKMSNQYLNDNDNETCYEPPKNTVRAEWTTPVWFTWTWLTFRNASNVSHLSLIVENDNGIHYILRKQLKIKRITSNIFEIQYLGLIKVSTLVIYWTGRGSVCSISVNGDHNIALGFNIISTLSQYRLIKELNIPITDGDLSGDNCVDFESQSYKTLIYNFVPSVWISTISIYPDITKEVNGTLHFSFASTTESKKIDIYDFIIGKKVSMYNFYLPVPTETMVIKVDSGKVHVCEMEIFGECRPPKYGLGCREVCSITCLGERCDYRGQCLKCTTGRTGPHCMDYITENTVKQTLKMIGTTQSNTCNSENCRSKGVKSRSPTLYLYVQLYFVLWVNKEI